MPSSLIEKTREGVRHERRQYRAGRTRWSGHHRFHQPAALPQRRRWRDRAKTVRCIPGVRCRCRSIGRGIHRDRRLFLRRRRPQGGGLGRSEQEARGRRSRFDRADGPEPAAAFKAGDRGGRRVCGRRRHGTGIVGRHARRRRGRHLRHLLPPFRGAVDRSRHHPAAAADRPFPSDRSDSHRTPGRRRRGAADGPCQPAGAQGRNPRPGDRTGEGYREIPANLHARRPAVGAAAMGFGGGRGDRQRNARRA